MRTSSIAVAVMLFAVSSFAQQSTTTATPAGTFRVGVFATDLGYTESSSTGRNFTGGVGVSLEYQLREKWSLELAGALEKHAEYITVIRTTPDVVFVDSQRIDRRTYPIDLIGNYHFRTSSRWKPFLGLGARYNSSRADRINGQINGGVHLQFSPHISLKLEAKRLLNNDDVNLDPATKASVGLAWRF